MSQKPSACFALIRTITNGKAAPSTTTTTTAADSRFAFWWYSSFDLHTFFYYLICLIDCHFLSVLFRRVSRRFAFYICTYIYFVIILLGENDYYIFFLFCFACVFGQIVHCICSCEVRITFGCQGNSISPWLTHRLLRIYIYCFLLGR